MPCTPSPCGLNSRCRELNNHAVCSCLPDMIGAPPNCRPECLVSSECPLDKSCINQKCKNPCENVCGLNARCMVVNHNPICSCELGYTGDPFVRCLKEEQRKRKYSFWFLNQSYIVNGTSDSYRFFDCRLFRSSANWNNTNCWLCSVSVRFQFTMSLGWRNRCVFMLTKLSWPRPKLSTRMHDKFWMPTKLSLYKWTLCRSMCW